MQRSRLRRFLEEAARFFFCFKPMSFFTLVRRMKRVLSQRDRVLWRLLLRVTNIVHECPEWVYLDVFVNEDDGFSVNWPILDCENRSNITEDRVKFNKKATTSKEQDLTQFFFHPNYKAPGKKINHRKNYGNIMTKCSTTANVDEFLETTKEKKCILVCICLKEDTRKKINIMQFISEPA